MSLIRYWGRALSGLPTQDSAELMAAKEYRPKEYYPLPVEYLEDDEALDLYSKELNPFLLGAIEPDMDTDDLRKAKEVKEETKAIYRRVSSAIVSTLEKK